MGEYADMEIEKGMSEPFPFGRPLPKKHKRRFDSDLVGRLKIEARLRACDEIAGVVEPKGIVGDN